jgi:hypothetical protein
MVVGVKLREGTEVDLQWLWITSYSFPDLDHLQ